MSVGSPPPCAARKGGWTPRRLIVVGAALGFGAAAENALVTFGANLAVLDGTVASFPYGALLLLDAALTAIAVPVGFFLVLCGLLFFVRSRAAPGPSPWFRASLGGAGVALSAGLLVGVLNFTLSVMPPELETLAFLRNIVVTMFAASLAGAVGLLLALCGIAALASRDASPGAGAARAAGRAPRGKDIYPGTPSAR